ncbi:MAG TPA: ABC transporter permease [Methanomicrobia archaeon]|nr:ABC transporter permease [Methanomicrobia archaeon]
MIWKVLAITRKDIQLYYYKGPVIVFGVLFPLFLFFAFSIGRNLPAAFLIPGLTAMTLFFTATSVSPVVMPWETQMRTLERLISCPITMRTLILGDILASFIFGVCISAVPVAVGVALGVGVQSPVILLAAIFLAAFCFSSLGSLFSSPPTSLVSNIVMLSTFVKFPVIFISGIFIPIEQMPGWGVAVASLSPLTYFTDLARFALQGVAYYPLTVDFAALLSFSALFLILAVKLHERALPKRF